MAAIGYNGFTGRTCFMHSAIDDPSVMSRTFLRAIFEYPFVKLNLSRVFAMVASTNARALKLDLGLGFTEINRFAAAGPDGDDLIMLQMVNEECRWIRGNHGRKEEQSSSGTGLRWRSEPAGGSISAACSTADAGQPA